MQSLLRDLKALVGEAHVLTDGDLSAQQQGQRVGTPHCGTEFEVFELQRGAASDKLRFTEHVGGAREQRTKPRHNR